MKIGDLFIKLGLQKGEFDKGIDQAKQKTSAFGSAMGKIGGMIAGVFAVGAIMNFGRQVFSMVTNFEQANATLAATLGATREQMKSLTNDAILYGKATSYTATQVSQLQNELAKLGFTQKEISNSTKAILDFAEATGSELASSAKIAGSALRAFGLDASEMGRITSVLAVATTKSALSAVDYESALSAVAPVAKTFGFTIEDTVALLGKLKDAGFDASSSATATRNILLNLADSNGKLTKAVGGPVKSFNELIPALVKLRNSGVDLNQTLELTDKRSVAAFNQFLGSAESALKLRDSLIGVNEELEKMVKTKTDTTLGAIKRLGSAWEGLVLTISGSKGILKDGLDFVSNIINGITEGIDTGYGKRSIGYGILRALGYGDEELDAVKKSIKKRNEEFAKYSIDDLNKLYETTSVSWLSAIVGNDDKAANKFSKEMDKIQARIKELNIVPDPVSKAKVGIVGLEESIKVLEKTIEDIQGKLGSGEIFEAEKISDATDEIKKYKSSLADLYLIYNNMNRGETMQPMTGRYQETGDFMLGQQTDLGGVFGNLDSHYDLIQKKRKKFTEEYLEGWKDFGEDLNNVIGQGVGDAINTMASGFGEMIATGDWDWGNFGMSILQTVGGFLQQLGALFVAYGVANMAFVKALLAGPTPMGAGLAIAAGIGLIAAGAAVSSFAQKGMSGGASATPAASGYSNYSQSNASAALSGNVVFELEGTKLRGALNNTDRRNTLIR